MNAQYELPRSTPELLELCKDQGWQVSRTTSGHYRIKPSNDADIITTSGTPSDHRAVMNFRGDLKRAGLLSRMEYLDTVIATRPRNNSSSEILIKPTQAQAQEQPTSQALDAPTAESVQAADQILSQATSAPRMTQRKQLKNVIVKLMNKHDPERHGLTLAQILEYARVYIPQLQMMNLRSALCGYADSGICDRKKNGKNVFYFLLGNVEEDAAVSGAMNTDRIANAAQRVAANGELKAGVRTGDKQTDEDLAVIENIVSAMTTFQAEADHARAVYNRAMEVAMDKLLNSAAGIEGVAKRNRAMAALGLKMRALLNQTNL